MVEGNGKVRCQIIRFDNFIFDIKNLIVGGADWSEIDHRIGGEFVGRNN